MYRKSNDFDTPGLIVGLVGVFSIPIIFFAAWLTHVVLCIKTASWLFLIAGAICFPIAIVHGIGFWFGAW